MFAVAIHKFFDTEDFAHFSIGFPDVKSSLQTTEDTGQ